MANTYSASEVGVPVASENVYPYRVGIMGGLVAGAVMALAMALWGAMSGHSVWYPVNMIAATVLRPLQNASPAEIESFMPAAALVGTLLHGLISIFLGMIFNTLLPTLPGSALVWGVIIGLLLWVSAQYALLPLINPMMDQLMYEPTFLLANVAYSLVLGWWVNNAEKIVPALR